jgi:hypothetical protein
MRFNLSLVVLLRRARWVSMALLAPLFLCVIAASTAFGQRCRFTGMVTLDSCCPPGEGSLDADGDADADGSAPIPDRLGSAACCERLVVTIAKSTGDSSERGPERIPAPVASQIERPERLPPARRAARDSYLWGARPPDAAPPAYLLKHAFLI